jgi:hypothetical protein
MDSAQATRRALSGLNFTIQKLNWWLRYRGIGEVMGEVSARVQRVMPGARKLEAVRQQMDRDFDRQHHVQTTGWISPSELSQRDAGGVSVPTAVQYSGYQGVEVVAFNRVLQRLAIDFTQYTFIDYGSGKGKSLLLASRFPFKEIIGVELVPELHEQAVRNIAAFSDEEQRCFRLSSIAMDAGLFEPPGGPLVCFLFDPFGPLVMERVIERLLQHDDTVYVIYANPKFRTMFQRAGFWSVFEEKGYRNIAVLMRKGRA